MTKIIFSQQALIGIDKQDLEVFRENMEKFYVIPMVVTCDGQAVNLDALMKYDSKFLSEFHTMLKEANRKKNSISFNICRNTDFMAHKNDDLIFIRPSDTILDTIYQQAEDILRLYTLKHQNNLTVYNSHSLSYEYARCVKKAVSYLGEHPEATADEVCDILKQDDDVVQFLYIPNRKRIQDNKLQSYARDKLLNLLNFTGPRSMLIVIDKHNCEGKLYEGNHSVSDLAQIVNNKCCGIMRASNSTLIIHESDKNILDPDTISGINAKIFYGKELDPITTICAGFGAALLELRI